MKKMILLVGAVLSLTLFSFENVQDKKLVRLKSGNYEALYLKLTKNDIFKLSEIKGFKESKAVQKTIKTSDLSEIQGAKGWEETTVNHKTGKTQVVHKTYSKNSFTKTIWKTKAVELRDMERMQSQVDVVMKNYL